MEETAITLLEFSRRIGALMRSPQLQRCWIVAEAVDVTVRGGHCYLELVQKNATTNVVEAKVRAVIWANVYSRLRVAFEKATGQPLQSGMKVMVEVSANFHEQYGLSLIVSNINPTYTLGDMARQRLEIVNRLKREGIIDLNKRLPWCVAPQRIAIVSADSAAGYGDFIDQLHRNPYGLKFYTKLFSAYMQGVNTVPSVLAALRRIEQLQATFDCVVVIRGGGATAELNVFDNYELAAALARFPLPTIVGIGHDRDYTVLDEVASVRVKTPTAAAEFLIDKGQQALVRLDDISQTIADITNQMLVDSRRQLDYIANTIPLAVKQIMTVSKANLSNYARSIPLCAKSRIDSSDKDLQLYLVRTRQAVEAVMNRERHRLEVFSTQVDLLSPRQVLRRGYSLVMCHGKFVTNASQLKPGDTIVTHFASGKASSNIIEIKE